MVVDERKSAHIRVAETSAYYALRCRKASGGSSSAARMADMMLTGRVYDAEEGQAVGLSHYLVPPGDGLERALELARRVAANAPITNFAVLQAPPRTPRRTRVQGSCWKR